MKESDEKRENQIFVDNKPVPIDLINKAKKSICKIMIIKDRIPYYGTGFFMNLNNPKKYLITNYHVISENMLDKEIYLEIYNQKKMNLKLENRDIKYFLSPKDITIIEIKNSDEIYEDIELLNYDLNYKFGYNIYKNVDVFSIEHPSGKSAACASGKIKDIRDFEFYHNISTCKGSSGCPIILLNDNLNIIQVIGMHKLFEHSKNLNCGTFIGEIFQEDLNYKNIIKVEDGKKNEGLNREKEKIKFSEAPKKLLNNEKPNLIENIEMNKKDISRVKSLYYNEIEIRKLIDSQDNIVNIEEYYLISMDWIEEFKKVFHYDDILASYASQMKDSLKIKNLPKIYISKEDTKRLKILRNTNIFERYDLSIFFYQSFCLISPKYFNIITDGYIIDERIKYNIYIRSFKKCN